MNLGDIFEETFSALTVNKMRSGLTMLGIVIGISSVVAMVSIGQGAKARIQSSIEGLGSNLLTILPGVVQPGRGIVSSGRGAARTLKNEDLPILQNVQGVKEVSPEVSSRFQVVSSAGNNTNTTIDGVQPEFLDVRNVALAEGSFISESGVRSLGRQAVLGASVAKDLFGDQDSLGKDIRVNKINFKVIGVLQAKGGIGFSGPDDMVLIPISTMQKIVSGFDYLTNISVSVADKSQMNAVKDAIIAALMQKHRVAEADFSVISQEDILGALTAVITTFTIFLASIASISLVVGGIGIMNMMLTTVTERTREIGLRKAIGATSNDISKQFLAESFALTFIGGGIGIILGWLVSFIVSKFFGIQTQISLLSIVLAFSVSAAIGIVFGYYPSRRAAKLNPIEALRYE